MSFTVPAPSPTPAPAPSPTPTPTPSPSPTPTPTPGETGYVNADGSFADGWHSRDEFKDLPNLQRFQSVPTLLKSYYALEQKMSSHQGAGVVVPGENAAPEVVAAYRKHLGIPDDAKGYAFKPESIPEGLSWDEGRAGKMADLFHQHGVPNSVAKAIVDHYLKDEIATHEQLKTRYDNLHAERQQELQKEWGPKFNEKMSTVKAVVQSLGMDSADPDLFGNPKVLSFLGKMTGLLSEDSLASMKGTVGKGGDFSSPAEEARAIQIDKNHPLHAAFLAGDREVTQRVSNLFRAAAAAGQG
jgi:hypothetical protein